MVFSDLHIGHILFDARFLASAFVTAFGYYAINHCSYCRISYPTRHHQLAPSLMS
jgi:hypothetical protein